MQHQKNPSTIYLHLVVLNNTIAICRYKTQQTAASYEIHNNLATQTFRDNFINPTTNKKKRHQKHVRKNGQQR